jgi:hypothetical protein
MNLSLSGLTKDNVLALAGEFFSISETHDKYFKDLTIALGEFKGIYYDGCLAKHAEVLILVVQLQNRPPTSITSRPSPKTDMDHDSLDTSQTSTDSTLSLSHSENIDSAVNNSSSDNLSSVKGEQEWLVTDVWVSPYESVVEHHKRALLHGFGQLYLSEDLRGMILGSIELQTLIESGECIQKCFRNHSKMVECNYFLSPTECERILFSQL